MLDGLKWDFIVALILFFFFAQLWLLHSYDQTSIDAQRYTVVSLLQFTFPQ